MAGIKESTYSFTGSVDDDHVTDYTQEDLQEEISRQSEFLYSLSFIKTALEADVQWIYCPPPHATPPPPNGGYDIWSAFNHSYEVVQGNEVFQEWENVTIFWYESSTVNAVFIQSWLNNTGEASYVYTNSFGQMYGLDEAHLAENLGVVSYGRGLPLGDANYSVNVGLPASSWYFFTWNTFETQNNPIGHNIWENVLSHTATDWQVLHRFLRKSKLLPMTCEVLI